MVYKRTIFTHIALAGFFLLAVSCASDKDKSNATAKLVIVTTTGMIKDAAEHVAGPHAEVQALMGSGVDPHLYKATQGDVSKLSNADVVFYNGLHLEGKMGDVLEKLGRSKAVISISSGIPDSLLRAVPGFQGTHDPHIWFDVDLWKNAVRTIATTLIAKDSVHAKDYETNRNNYLSQLDSLHHAIQSHMLEVPEQQRVLITAHDAFGYFGDAYKVEVKGLQGISTMSEFGVKDVTDLVNFIIRRKIKAIFVETSVSKKSIEAVVEGCRDKGWNVVIGGSLYSDAMGNAGTPEGSYIGMVNANVQTIVNALK